MKLIALTIALIILVLPLAVFGVSNLLSAKSQISPRRYPIRVACVGDSITAASEYPSDLQIMLGDNYTVGNFGVVGSTVSLNSWKPYMNQTEFQNAEDFEPDIVVIMLGTNDDLKGLHQYNDNFEDDYNTLVTSFQQLDSKPNICIANSPPIFSNNTDLSPSYLANTIIPKTDDLAYKMNLQIIDVYNAFSNHADYLKDGVHPNSQGAVLIATQVYDAINSQNS